MNARGIDRAGAHAHGSSMSFTAKVHNGVIVLPPDVHLPEGAEVEVISRDESGSAGIEKTSDICGGDACIAHTRIPVWVLEQHRRLGATDAELLADYPSLAAPHLREAWAYVCAHRAEIDRAIADNEEA